MIEGLIAMFKHRNSTSIMLILLMRMMLTTCSQGDALYQMLFDYLVCLE
jgi:hypothetical protein